MLNLIENEIVDKRKPNECLACYLEGVQFPQGTFFRAKYKGFFYFAMVEDGALVLHNRRYLSPTAAAFSITRKPHIDGWFFWEYKATSQSEWEPISNRRTRNSLEIVYR